MTRVKEVNFLAPSGETHSQGSPLFAGTTFAVSALLIVWVVLSTLTWHGRAAEAEDQLAQMEASTEEADGLLAAMTQVDIDIADCEDQVERLESQIDIEREMAQRFIEWPSLVDGIAECMPPGAWVAHIERNPQSGEVEVSGQATEESEVIDLIVAMAGQPWCSAITGANIENPSANPMLGDTAFALTMTAPMRRRATP